MSSKRESIKAYLKTLLNYLDGRGIVITDEELVNANLNQCGDFITLQEIVKEGK